LGYKRLFRYAESHSIAYICYLIFYKNDIFLEKRSASSLFS
jgi:hypothetical protein